MRINSFYTIEKYDIISSTNTVLKEMAKNGEKEGKVLVANEQTAGKGRLGRSFYSPADTGIYMSILLKPEMRPEDSLLITCAAAVAVSEAIENQLGHEVGIKWVNDIYYKNRKVCGILAESAIDMQNGNVKYIVLGIGVNISKPKDDFPEDIINKAGGLVSEVTNISKDKLIEDILNNFKEYYDVLKDKTYLEKYRSRSILDGKEITYEEENETKVGKVLGIDDDFRIIIENNKEIKHLAMGEVQLNMNGING